MLNMKNMTIAAAIMTLASSSLFAGGGGATIPGPSIGTFSGYGCVNEQTFRRTGPAKIKTPSLTAVRVSLSDETDGDDLITAKLNGCKVTLTGKFTPNVDFDIHDASTSCDAGLNLTKILSVSSHNAGWYGDSNGNVLGIKLDQQLLGSACAADESAYIFFDL